MFSLGILLAIFGLIFVLVEFFLPGGLLAILGCAFLLVSILFVAIALTVWWLLAYLISLAFFVGIACQIALFCIRKSGKRGSYYLSTSQEGFQVGGYDPSLTSRKAVVLTDLKPSGHVLIEGESFQARSSAGYLSQGAEVVVVKVEGTRLIVR